MLEILKSNMKSDLPSASSILFIDLKLPSIDLLFIDLKLPPSLSKVQSGKAGVCEMSGTGALGPGAGVDGGTVNYCPGCHNRNLAG